MKTTGDGASVRLYHLDDDIAGNGATTLFYGPLAEALALAEQQPEAVQQDLFIATDNDVIAYIDLIGE